MDIYYVRIGTQYWVSGCDGMELSKNFIPSELALTTNLNEAEPFLFYDSAKNMADAAGGTVYTPKGKLVPVNDEEVE